MSNLLGVLTQAIGGNAVNSISKQLGVNSAVGQTAVQAALPMIMKALSRNAKSEQGATSLLSALKNDHDGSVLDNLDNTVGNWQQGPGAGILKHVLGGRRGNVEQYVGQSSGLNTQQSGQLLEMLAPMVMGALGRQQRQEGLGANALSELLINSNRANNAAAPQQMGVLSKILDRDGDGKVGDDLTQIGANFLQGLFRK